MKSQWRISSENCGLRRRRKQTEGGKHLDKHLFFLDHIFGRQSSNSSSVTSRLGSLFLVEIPHILIDYFNPEFTSKLINCENSTRNFQHIFITKKLCIHIEFSKFWLLEYLKSAKLHPRWSILNEKGKAFNIDHSDIFVPHWFLWRVSFCECMDRRGGG